eukprot:239861_1
MAELSVVPCITNVYAPAGPLMVTIPSLSSSDANNESIESYASMDVTSNVELDASNSTSPSNGNSIRNVNGPPLYCPTRFPSRNDSLPPPVVSQLYMRSPFEDGKFCA